MDRGAVVEARRLGLRNVAHVVVECNLSLRGAEGRPF